MEQQILHVAFKGYIVYKLYDSTTKANIPKKNTYHIIISCYMAGQNFCHSRKVKIIIIINAI